MMTTGIVVTGYGAMSTGVPLTMTGTLDFGGAGVVLATIVCASLVGGLAAICVGAMRQLTVPTARGIHGPAIAARGRHAPNLAAAA